MNTSVAEGGGTDAGGAAVGGGGLANGMGGGIELATVDWSIEVGTVEVGTVEVGTVEATAVEATAVDDVEVELPREVCGESRATEVDVEETTSVVGEESLLEHPAASDRPSVRATTTFSNPVGETPDRGVAPPCRIDGCTSDTVRTRPLGRTRPWLTQSPSTERPAGTRPRSVPTLRA